MTDAIVILGIFAADTAYRADRLPRMGETLLGRAFTLGPGGKGSNQAVAAARAGGRVTFITKTGKDAFADLAHRTWADAGVTPAVERMSDEATGAAFIFLDAHTGDNAIIVCPGAAGTLVPADIDARADLIRAAGVFVTQLETPLPAALHALRLAREGGARTILNPAPAAALPEGMLALCDYLTPNESEAEALTGIAVRSIDDAERAARALIDGGAAAVVVTLGANGAFHHDGRQGVHVPAHVAGHVVETTGAGDAFNGAFATSIAAGADPVDAVRFGCAAAGISVTRPGAAASMPALAEIEAALGR